MKKCHLVSYTEISYIIYTCLFGQRQSWRLHSQKKHKFSSVYYIYLSGTRYKLITVIQGEEMYLYQIITNTKTTDAMNANTSSKYNEFNH